MSELRATAVSLSGESTLGKSKKTCDLETFLHVAQQSKEMMRGEGESNRNMQNKPKTGPEGDQLRSI